MYEKACKILLYTDVVKNSFAIHVGVFISFMGETLPDHSYVNLSLVETAIGGSVQCHTDLNTCCSGGQGADRGDWYFPSGDRLNFSGDPGDIYESRVAQRVDLRRRNNGDTSGIYRCDIETNAVHSDNNSDKTTRETVYVGLYDTGGRCDYCFMLALIVKKDVSMSNLAVHVYINNCLQFSNSQVMSPYQVV